MQTQKEFKAIPDVCITALIVLFILALLAFFVATPTHAQTAIPQPTAGHLVQDLGHGLLGNDAASLDAKLLAYEKESGNEISVVSIFDLKGDSIDEYAPRLFKQWGIGKKGKDNGLLILWAIKDRKVRIEVGYGLEDRITDGKAGAILRNDILSHFKNADFYKGLDQGTTSLITVLKIPPSVPTPLDTTIPPTTSIDVVFLIVVVGLALFIAGCIIWFMCRITRKSSDPVLSPHNPYHRVMPLVYSTGAGIANSNRNNGYNMGITRTLSPVPIHTPTIYPSSSSASDSSPSFSFGGGMSGGGGASGGY